MSSLRICPVCGANLPGDAPRGLCPRCLFGQAIGVPHPDSVQSPESASDKPRAGVQRAVQSSARQGPATRAPDVQRFGDYELFGELAEGGMGAVYYARQISLNRFVALKMIRSGQLASAAEVQRFRTEAEAAANLDHPNIVPIYEIGEQSGQHYFSMKLMEGGTLADLNSECAARDAEWLRRAAILVATVARAVHHAHQRGVLHR